MQQNFAKVSVHGGHSGSYCNHAVDPLEQVVQRYIDLGFEWVCLTEHMPTKNPALIAPEEQIAGFNPNTLHNRFAAYFQQARALQAQHKRQIEIFVGFETEAYSGYAEEVQELISTYNPDMIVGSVHHIQDILYDASLEHYQQAASLSGGIEQMYCDYFDKQLELINRFEPAVVGHFDLIRIFDDAYQQRWQIADISDRAIRNLDRIKELDLILDFNVRALVKGAKEPYISSPWLQYAIDQDIKIALGDDSHGVSSVGGYMQEAVDILVNAHGHTQWPKPPLHRHKN